MPCLAHCSKANKNSEALLIVATHTKRARNTLSLQAGAVAKRLPPTDAQARADKMSANTIQIKN